jgi:hypothetical protein
MHALLVILEYQAGVGVSPRRLFAKKTWTIGRWSVKKVKIGMYF